MCPKRQMCTEADCDAAVFKKNIHTGVFAIKWEGIKVFNNLSLVLQMLKKEKLFQNWLEVLLFLLLIF